MLLDEVESHLHHHPFPHGSDPLFNPSLHKWSTALRGEGLPVRDQTGWWLQADRRDLEAAELLVQGGIYELASFHCHQAAEKSLKALFVERGVTERTHSGLELLSRLRQDGLQISDDLFHQVRKLDRSYIDSRYPSGVTAPEHLYDKKTAEELYQWAQSVMAFVQSNLT